MGLGDVFLGYSLNFWNVQWVWEVFNFPLVLNFFLVFNFLVSSFFLVFDLKVFNFFQWLLQLQHSMTIQTSFLRYVPQSFVLFTCCFVQWLLQLQCFNDFSNFILKYVPQSFVFVLFFLFFFVFCLCVVLFSFLCCFLVVCLLLLGTSYHVPCVFMFCSTFTRPTNPKYKMLWNKWGSICTYIFKAFLWACNIFALAYNYINISFALCIILKVNDQIHITHYTCIS
jgi:hypothetical protein